MLNKDPILLRGSPEVSPEPPEEMYLLTPMLPGRSRIRVRLFVSKNDKAKTGRGKWEAIITDVPTGRRFRVRGASCGIRTCFCAARIIEEI